MDILKVIEKDHREAKKLIKKLEGKAGDNSAGTHDMVKTLVLEVRVHAKAEERALYERCKEEGGKFKDFVMEGLIEHKLLDSVLATLLKTSPGNEDEFKAALTVAKELIEHHGEEEEEEELFPKLKKKFDAEARAEMGAFMIAEKERIKAELEPKIHSMGIPSVRSSGRLVGQRGGARRSPISRSMRHGQGHRAK